MGKIFDVIVRGKVVESFDSYESAWKYADKVLGAIVRWYEEPKES